MAVSVSASASASASVSFKKRSSEQGRPHALFDSGSRYMQEESEIQH